jgi:PAS domain S-box-containing protein
MKTIPGYTLIDPICEAGDLVLYQARRTKDGLPVLVKIPASPRPSQILSHRLEHEYELARDLDTKRIARPLALEHHAGTPVLVLEQGPTRSLASLVGSPMDIKSFLQIAIGITAALAGLHRSGLVHKDIRPEHLLLDMHGHVWLTGLGIASQLPRERQSPDPPEVIAGTLAYMAPEQTGLMNRSVDSRSDLYALGVTLYQMLSGVLPFKADDPMEWFHCHIARQPVPLTHRVTGFPEPLSEIIMKLLAKTGDERYQSVIGLEADLRRCQAEWESKTHISHFPLGAHDLSDRLLIPERLYGRESEIGALLAAFDRVLATGMPEIMLVSGYSGIGKTSVVYELHKVLVPPRGLFATGKFDQYKRNIPYATLVQSLQILVRHILSKSETEIGTWRDTICDTVTPNGQLIVSLIPEVELIIGEQPPVPDLPPQEARNRFQRVLINFLGCFARPEHPLVLFLDDLQWLDRATLDLIEHLGTEQDIHHLLLIGAYRDNEVGPTHPLMRVLEAIRKAGTNLQEIVLAPLSIDDVCALIVDSLHCEWLRALPLAQLVHEKTGGNPFFALQFLTSLTEEELLTFDSPAPGWRWDMERIRARNYTDNVVELMAEKLQRLASATQEALKQLACLGNVVEIDTLAAAFGKTEEAIRSALWQAALAGLVFQQENICKFLHDRIQQASYSLIPEQHRAEVHLHIGRALLAKVSAKPITEQLFDIANHLNRGAELLSDRDEKAQVAEINLRTGRKAKASAAFTSACVYFAAGMDLLDERDWEERYELTFNLWIERAECEFLTGNFDTAERLIEVLLQRGRSKIDRAAVYHLKVLIHVLKSENPQAVDSALTCLRMFDIDIPAHPSPEQVQAEYDTLWRNLEKHPIESLIDLPMMTDPELLAAMEVLSVLLGAAYFTDIQLHRLHLCRMVNISIEHGVCGPTAHGCGFLGYILGPSFHRYDEAYRFGKLACDLAEKHDFFAYKARTYVAMALVAVWSRPLEIAVDFNRAAFHAATETGSPEMASYSLFHLLADLFLRNDPLDNLWRESEIALHYVREAKFHDVADIIVSKQRLIAAMQGRTRSLSSFSDAQFDEAAFEAGLTADRMPMLVCLYWITKLKARYLSGDYTEVIVAADKVKPMLWAAAAHIHLLDYYFYTALAVTALYEEAPEKKQAEWRELLASHQEQLREWAENYPPNFADKHDLVAAEIARIEGREMEAMRLYDQAFVSARDNDLVQQQALAAEVAARFYQVRGLERIAHANLRDAHAAYARWGAQGKVRQLERLHPWLAYTEQPQTATLAEHLDALSLAKAQRAISSEIGLDNLVQTLLRIVIESAGAQKGFLSVEGASQLSAEIRTGSDNSQQIVFDTSPRDENIPGAVINYVKHSRDTVILDDASAHTGEFSEDDYLRRVKPKSVLCMAIQRQDKLLGVLYLENNLVSGAFTPERRTVLEILAAQAAISLETTAVYEALQESEERLRSVLNAAEIVAWEANPEKGRLFEAGPVGKLFGRGKDFSHPNVDDFAKSIHPDDRDRVMDSIHRALHGEGDYNEEFRVPMANGSVRWIAANGNLQTYTEGKSSRLLGIAREITNQKLAEEAIAWNLVINQALSSLYIPLVVQSTSIEQIAAIVLEKCRQLTSSAHGYVAEIDPENGDLIAHTNTKMMQTECAIIEEEFHKIRFPRGADGRYNGLWGHALNTKEPFYTDEPVKHPSSVGIPEGHIIIERFLTVPVLLAGELVGQIALSNSTRAYTDRDVDAINRIAEFYALAIQHKRAEDELRTHRDHLEELVKQRAAELTIARDVAEEARRLAEDANKAKSIFLANISHELRTPLNAILGYSQLMQRDASLLPEQQDYLNTINRSGEHLLALINDVLEISKIEAGQITLDVATFDLWALLDDLENMFRVRTDAKDLRLDFIGINDVPRYLESDENKLRQILINVLGNAVKFTKRGRVTLRVSVKGMDQEPVYKDTKYLCFEVEDTGVGIVNEELDKVFAAFEQTESGRMSKTGTGLGMAITQNYVHMMGGDIIVVSTPGKGSIFRFEISVSVGRQADIKAQTMQQKRVISLEPDQDVPRILVAEDLEESRTMLVKLLRLIGCHVQEAANGKQAIEIFHQWHPNFIWMDIRMPVMGGLEATRHIKETETGKSTVVAALTAHALKEERKQIMAAGCDDVVRKPFREQDIFEVMKKHLGLKYVYEDAGEEAVPVKSNLEIGPEQLAALPADLLSQLYQAALELNEQQSLAMIEKIKPIDVHIARKLEILVRNFAYDSLQDLVKRSEQPSPEDTHD